MTKNERELVKLLEEVHSFINNGYYYSNNKGGGLLPYYYLRNKVYEAVKKHKKSTKLKYMTIKANCIA